ncbi:tyrosine-type recombinase/integrase [Rahnella laticis]|uniref:tyrosine-type recombinase/integrase n=1 Tax=Rahnella laticis TaxID=2787622 RepID=UPI0018A2D92D|nr:tyrosine-type recombinase/integrase [Rahnella laticis]MBF7997757.1 tyrosine-type recombinase/integrase [Rahnella laticis]
MTDMTTLPGPERRPLLMVRPEDHRRALALRQMAMAYADLPRYLLLPEVSALLHYLPDWSQHALVSTLWNTGGRINEVLALKRRDFRLNGDYPHVVIRTAKQRRAGTGRPAKGKSANRVVPLSDPGFVDELRRLFASTRERIETDAQTGERRALPIWTATDRTVRNWLTRAVDDARRDGVTFSVPVTPHVFRHSYAMHHCYQHTPLKVLQALLGHEKAESTEVYTRVFALDIASSQQITFSMPESQAVTLLKETHRESLIFTHK